MQSLLIRRTLRDLKANTFRYFALFLLIALSMFIVISVVGSAESITVTVDEKASATDLEDGQFGMFAPLDKKTIKEIQGLGVTLEESFYLDFKMYDKSVLRLMKNRTKLNRVVLTEGRLAESKREIVLERLYAEAHQLSCGDTIAIAGKNFQISGIGTTSDYDLCLQNMSDMSADGSLFGTAFVTPEAYDMLNKSGQALHTQEYRYSYRLGDGISNHDLKDALLNVKIDPSQVKDKFFQEMIHNVTKERDAFTEGIGDLTDGTSKMNAALQELNTGSGQLDAGIRSVNNGLAQLNSKSSDLTSGSSQVLTALKELKTASEKLTLSSASIKELQSASGNLLTGVKELDAGLQKLVKQVNYKGFESAVSYMGIDQSHLSNDAKQLLAIMEDYLTEVNTSLVTAAKGSASLSKNFRDFDTAINQLPEMLEELNSGLAQFQSALSALSTEYKKMDSGISAYTDAVKQIYEGYGKISEGSQNLRQGTGALAENGQLLRKGTSELQKESKEMLDEYFPVKVENLTDFVNAADNPRIKASNGDVRININVGIMAGIIILILITYVISVFVIHSIDLESAMIGALYALGIKRQQLMLHYTMLPVLLCLLGGAVGTLLGYSETGISMMAGESSRYFSIPAIETHYSPYLLVYGLLLPPLVAFLVNWVVIRKRLYRSALSLLRKEQPQRTKASDFSLKKFNFVRTFQIRQFLREKRSCFAVMTGMFISLLILILGLNCYALCRNVQLQNKADTKYEYMYQFKYPTEEVPAGGYAAYAEALSKEIYGYDMEISIIGLTEENPFFPSITSARKNEISISSSTANKYGLAEGDKLVLSDKAGETDYSFTVKEVVPYSVGLSCFMDIESMRSLFGKEKDYYNVVYADQVLDIEVGRLYTVTTREDVEKSSDIFMEIMLPLITVLIGVSILLFLIVLYQMIRVMIDRASVSISLMKIFGYQDKEIRRLYLDGNFLLIAMGALVMIPAAKLLMDAIYPSFIANVACGVDLNWPPLLYLAVYAGILLCYLLIRTVLLRRVKKMIPAEVLKDRE